MRDFVEKPEIYYGQPLVFDEARHRYTWDGKPVPGVTTILGRLSKPALIQWAADMSVKWIEQKCQPLGVGGAAGWSVTREDLADARLAHRRFKEAAADIGSNVHAYAEAVLSGAPTPELETEQAREGAAAFERWLKQFEVRPLARERRVFSREHWYAGTCDLVAYIGNQPAILDFKTSSGLYPEMWLQLAAYSLALQEEYPSLFDGRHHYIWLVHLNKKTGAFNAVAKNMSGHLAETFLAVRNVHRAMQDLEADMRPPRVRKKGDRAAA